LRRLFGAPASAKMAVLFDEQPLLRPTAEGCDKDRNATLALWR
jgi:hypothetical protein